MAWKPKLSRESAASIAKGWYAGKFLGVHLTGALFIPNYHLILGMKPSIQWEQWPSWWRKTAKPAVFSLPTLRPRFPLGLPVNREDDTDTTVASIPYKSTMLLFYKNATDSQSIRDVDCASVTCWNEFYHFCSMCATFGGWFMKLVECLKLRP